MTLAPSPRGAAAPAAWCAPDRRRRSRARQRRRRQALLHCSARAPSLRGDAAECRCERRIGAAAARERGERGGREAACEGEALGCSWRGARTRRRGRAGARKRSVGRCAATGTSACGGELCGTRSRKKGEGGQGRGRGVLRGQHRHVSVRQARSGACSVQHARLAVPRPDSTPRAALLDLRLAARAPQGTVTILLSTTPSPAASLASPIAGPASALCHASAQAQSAALDAF